MFSKKLELLGFKKNEQKTSPNPPMRFPLFSGRFFFKPDVPQTLAYDETGEIWILGQEADLTEHGFATL